MASPQSTSKAGISLATVIAELQFIQQLRADSPRDPRLGPLLNAAKNDLAAAAKAILPSDDSADDPIIRTQTDA
jgi:hypothetical protein